MESVSALHGRRAFHRVHASYSVAVLEELSYARPSGSRLNCRLENGMSSTATDHCGQHSIGPYARCRSYCLRKDRTTRCSIDASKFSAYVTRLLHQVTSTTQHSSDFPIYSKCVNLSKVQSSATTRAFCQRQAYLIMHNCRSNASRLDSSIEGHILDPAG